MAVTPTAQLAGTPTLQPAHAYPRASPQSRGLAHDPTGNLLHPLLGQNRLVTST